MHDELYGYAVNQDGELVYISHAIAHGKGLGHSYHCLNKDCNSDMIVVNGKVKASHFRHKVLVCSQESYQHQLAKELIKQRINQKQKINLVFPCVECGCTVREKFELPSTIAYAETERKYPDSPYTGDVAGYSANGDLEIMFEVFHTHLVDDVKRDSVKKWVEVNAEQIIQEDYQSNKAVFWNVLRSAKSGHEVLCQACISVKREAESLHEFQQHRHQEHIVMLERAKGYIQKHIDNKAEIGLMFSCDVCKKLKYPIRMPSRISHAAMNFQLPDTKFQADVVGLSEDGSPKLIIMLDRDQPSTLTKQMEHFGIDKWIAVDSHQVLSSKYKDTPVALQWEVKYSAATNKKLTCPDCKNTIAALSSPNQQERFNALVEHRGNLKLWGDIYAVHLDNFYEVGLQDLKYICDQIDLIKNIINREYDDDLEKKKTKYISLLFKIQFVHAIQFIMLTDCAETRRVLSLTGKNIKQKFLKQLWKDVYKGLRDQCDEAWFIEIGKLLFGYY
ncbi:hypothetical protein [Acinetobacter sp. ANC 4862]|uniref:hypothetical protein n=1 Tax=Acinetobacter sp. ANC 4862 TaxID=2529849 RepID=UPI001038BB24|nr:hypothetical protein [Acinetobacter sp. ANC 4862]TCH60506.1 hypothetical protein E0409_16090 [Acinetobacter sp. ANC 4862]